MASIGARIFTFVSASVIALSLGAVAHAAIDEEGDEEGIPPGAVLAEIEARMATAPPPGMVMPPGAVGGPPGATMPPTAPARPGAPTPQELASIKALLESLPAAEQEEMKAFYRDMGFDLDALLGIGAQRMAQMNRARQVVEMLRQRDFSRQTQAVLEARSRLALGVVPHPDLEKSSPAELAQWLHLQYLAGEWEWLRNYFATRPQAEAQIVYAGILQSIRPNAALLPEEVLQIANAAPAAPTRQQIVQFGTLLRAASERYSTSEMLARLRSDARHFGMVDAERRTRTIELLTAAGLLREAAEYLPPLEDARTAGDGRLMLAHAVHARELADALPQGLEAETARRKAWDLMAEIALMDKLPFETRRTAMREAVTAMTRMPRPVVLRWLDQLFASETLGPAALEVMATTAAAVGDADGDPEERARTIVALKEAVDMLLARQSAESPAFQLPLRMLTTALVAEMEGAMRGSDQARENMQPWMMPQPVSRDVESLASAIPNRAWIDALEPSLAARVVAACIGVALAVDDVDLALSLLRDAVQRSPADAEKLGSVFLARWGSKLRPSAPIDDGMYMFFSRWNMSPAAPLTRGRQRRNMDRLREMVQALQASGLDTLRLPQLAAVFQACHGSTEVYEREDVERVFGPIESMPPSISVMLARSMAANLGGEWRDRAVHRRAGVRRTDAEIAGLVDRGYDLALALMDSALRAEPESWRLAAMKSALSFDRQIFLEQQRSTPSGKLEDVRAATFAAFEEAASRYARAVVAGEEREDAEVFVRWFGVAMGSPGMLVFRADDMPTTVEGPNDPIERIRSAIMALPADSAGRHLAEFARAASTLVGRADASVKPKLVRHALRIVGDHPAGAGLRALDTLYHDLVRDEIRLRLTIDGDDRVGVGEPFGVMLSLRCTAAVERETGGFAKYLQTSVPIWSSNGYQEKNYRETLEKDIREAFGKGLELQAISFFDPFIPSRGVIEDGNHGWVEKPFAYLVVTRRDPSVDRLPSIPLEMQFSDSTGPVTLISSSNAPALAIGDERSLRPCPELAILQVVDARDASEPGASEIRLEVRMRGKGVLPALAQAIDGLDGAVDGYRADLGSVRETPIVTLGDDQSTRGGMYFYGPPRPPKGGYPEPDDRGIYRPTLERSWTVTYLPESAGGETGSEFRLPALRSGVEGTLENRYYSDVDIAAATGPTVSITPRSDAWRMATVGGSAGVLVLLAGAGVIWARRRGSRIPSTLTEVKLPGRITPMSTVTALRRLRASHGERLDGDSLASLDAEIASLERRYFGADDRAVTSTNGHDELGASLHRWAQRAEGRRN